MKSLKKCRRANTKILIVFFAKTSNNAYSLCCFHTQINVGRRNKADVNKTKNTFLFSGSLESLGLINKLLILRLCCK